MAKVPISITIDESLLTAIDTVRPGVISRSAAIEGLINRALELPPDGTGGPTREH